MSNPETKLTLAIRKALELDPDVIIRRINSSGYRSRMRGAPAGTSDLIGGVELDCDPPWVGGRAGHRMASIARFFALEVKTPDGGDATPVQQKFIDDVRAIGGFATVVRSVDDAREAIKRAKNGESE